MRKFFTLVLMILCVSCYSQDDDRYSIMEEEHKPNLPSNFVDPMPTENYYPFAQEYIPVVFKVQKCATCQEVQVEGYCWQVFYLERKYDKRYSQGTMVQTIRVDSNKVPLPRSWTIYIYRVKTQ